VAVNQGRIGRVDEVLRRDAGRDETRRANAAFWDAYAPGYQRDHAPDLGTTSFVWGPEGATEDDLGLLGDVRGRRVLEVGCGAVQCARWLAARGATVAAFDLSAEQLRLAGELGGRSGGGSGGVPLVRADAEAVPFADGVFDLACSAYGALPFVADSARVMREVARVLRPGGRWVFSVTHPVRWCFPDDPGPAGLTVSQSYFDRTPYVEQDAAGTATYVEHHRTFGDRVREVVAAGLRIVDVVEPEWPEGHETTYEQWGALRGRLIPGTAIWVTEKPA
jgi:SAM-dependent methyltransferase